MFKSLLYLILLYYISACTGSRPLRKATLSPVTPWSGLTNPRYIEGELRVLIKNIKVYDGSDLKENNRRNKISAGQEPVLRLWSPQIQACENQRNVQWIQTQPAPSEVYNDVENGNKILFWDLSAQLQTNDSIVVRRRFSYITYEYKPDAREDSLAIDSGEIPKEIRRFYTKSEPFLVQTPVLKNLADSIAGTEKNPFEQAKALHHWVYKHIIYEYPPEARGAGNALKTLRGDCGQYSALFIALARALEIPARQQSGFSFSSKRISYHVWSEVYLAHYGWFPVDATRKKGFGFLDNRRLTASKGMNIPLAHVPHWASYRNSEAQEGRTDFMQLVTIVKSGFKADISTSLIVLYDSLLK